MEYYIHWLDITSLTRFDTALCNAVLRPVFLELCEQYINNSEIYTISDYYKYIYLRKIKITNLIIFNNRQLQLFYFNLVEDNHITYLSISDCCIDNKLINLMLTKLSKLKVLKIGIFKFTNSVFDRDNDSKYELSNIYSRLFLVDEFTYYVNLQYMEDFNYHIFKVKNITFDVLDIIPLKCPHDEYLLDDCNIIDSQNLQNSQNLIPLKYAVGTNGLVINIMNNIVGDIGTSANIPLEELHIHNTNNLTYSNIIPLLKSTKLKKLSLHFCTDGANILEILQYDIPFIEIVNKRLIFDNIIDVIIALSQNIKILKIYINNDEKKINISLTTDEQTPKVVSITLWTNGWYIPSFEKLLSYCINIDELVVNTPYVFEIIKRCNAVEFLKINLKTIRINYLDWPLYFDKYISKDDIQYLLS